MAEAPRKQIQRLFNANPPPLGSPLLGHLFVDREAELRLAVEFLTADTAFDPQIYAVSGDSRTGKSHLVLRIIDRLQRHFEIVNINANSAGTARSALRQIYFALRDWLGGLVDRGEADRAAREMLNWAQDLALLVNDQVDSATSTVTHAFKGLLQARVGFGSSHIEVTGEASREASSTLTVGKPDDPVLARHVSMLASGVLDASDKPLLINIDDLDLLNHPDDPRGVAEAEALLGLLGELSAHERVCIIASVRNRFFTSRDKQLKRFVEVRAFSSAFLREVIEKQVRVLHADEQIFTVDCRDALIKLAQGRVGVLLDQCGRLWHDARLRGIDLPIGTSDFKRYVEGYVERLARTPSTAAAMRKIVDAVMGDAPARELELPEVDPEDGPFAYLIVRPMLMARPGRVELVPEAVTAIRAVFGERSA